jgi:hypothetical protein
VIRVAVAAAVVVVAAHGGEPDVAPQAVPQVGRELRRVHRGGARERGRDHDGNGKEELKHRDPKWKRRRKRRRRRRRRKKKQQ